jgi:hypothetical protein
MMLETKPGQSGHGWQLLLADLALILFLLTLTALPNEDAAAAPLEQAVDVPAIAASQALFRPVAGGPSLREWLTSQPLDPRATLTIFVRYRGDEEAQAWQHAQQLAREATTSGARIRTIVAPGEISESYASLAFDDPQASAEVASR